LDLISKVLLKAMLKALQLRGDLMEVPHKSLWVHRQMVLWQDIQLLVQQAVDG